MLFLRRMANRFSLWHNLALCFVASAAFVGCSNSHTDEDCSHVTARCLDACCRTIGGGEFDQDCNLLCPSGSEPLEACTPAPGCGHCGDAGPLPLCKRGDCCEESVPATQDPKTCEVTCPDGYSLDCQEHPAAMCLPTWARCEEPADCILAPAGGCCFPCGESLELEDVTAIRHSRAAEYYALYCPGELECPACVPATNVNLQATCIEHSCEAIDVRRLPLSACTSDEQCRLRVPDCCECDADTRVERLIALNADEVDAYVELVCGSSAGACPCEATYPDTVEAYCAADGHCAIRPTP